MSDHNAYPPYATPGWVAAPWAWRASDPPVPPRPPEEEPDPDAPPPIEEPPHPIPVPRDPPRPPLHA